MRLNAERDRVYKFKDIVRTESKRYYNILEQFSKMLEDRKGSGESGGSPQSKDGKSDLNI